MGVAYNPKIVTTGLVLCLDSANPKSYANYNLATYSQDFGNAVYSKSVGLVSATGLLAPDGTLTASTLTDDVNGTYEYFGRAFTVPNDSASYNISIYIKKTTGGTSSRTGFNVSLSGGTTLKYYNIRFNADTGVGGNGDTTLITSESNNYWRLSFTVSNNSTGNTILTVEYFPATGFYDATDNSAATGSHTVWGLQVTRGAALLPYKTNVNDSVDAWNDISVTKANATLYNGTTFKSNNSGCISFDGVNDLGIVNMPRFSASSDLTIDAWVYPTGLSFYNVICGRGYASTGYPHYVLRRHNGAGWSFLIGDLTTAYGIIDNDIPTLNVWQNVTAVLNRSENLIRLYVNGVQKASGSVAGIGSFEDASGDLTIGRQINDVNYTYFLGDISSIKIYNRALTVAEIGQNYKAAKGRFGL